MTNGAVSGETVSDGAKKKPFVIGLTGSIGMGKSETAKLFAGAGCLVFDADSCVHRLYGEPTVAAEIEAAFPGTTNGTGVDRAKLSAALTDENRFARLETLVHPYVVLCLSTYLDVAEQMGARFVVLDIPLLFETGWAQRCQAIVTVSAGAAVQRARVLARPGMTEEKFARILSRQLPDAEKRRRADFVVCADRGLDDARRQVDRILAQLAERA